MNWSNGISNHLTTADKTAHYCEFRLNYKQIVQQSTPD